jgi:AraC family transcriptional regulator
MHPLQLMQVNHIMTTDYSKSPIMIVEDCQTPGLHNSLLNHNEFKNLVLIDSQKALVYLDETDVATIVLDLNLPISTGLNLLRLIASSKPHIPIVVVTDINQIDTAVECMKLGAYDYLIKPVSLERITDSIKSALDVRCLNEVASLLRETPCIQGGGALSGAYDESGPAPFILPEDVPERLRNAVDFMDLNLSKPLSLEMIAQKAFLSKYHFCREFKKHIGISPIRFMMNRRVCQATLLLQNKELSISRVAIQSGFNDQSEFTKWFKKTTGFTPSWYRKSFETRERQQPVPLR